MATALPSPRTVLAKLEDVPLQHRVVVWVLCFLAGWPALKFSNVQYLEMFMLGHLTYLFLRSGLTGFQFQLRGLWKRPGYLYGLILLAILLTTLSSLRLKRYPPPEGPFFIHYPLLAMLLRYVELFIVAFYSVYIAELMRRNSLLRDFGLRTYVNSALITSLMTFGGLAFFKITGNTFLVTGEGRGQGEFPEGGPWGLYLLTVAIVAWILWRRRMITRGRWWFTLVVLGGSFYICKSKACALCALMVFVTQIFFGHSLKQKIASAALLGVTCGAAWYIFDVPQIWAVFSNLQASAEVTVAMNEQDPNISYGRVAGSVVVPRMIAKHPITGIGMGNYPVMRNDPEYLGIMRPNRSYDLPGLGLLWVAAELGIPLLLALYVMMLYPAFRVVRAHGNPLLLTLALCQPYVHLMGAQITLFYPWLASAFVLSFLPLPGAAVRARVRRPVLSPTPASMTMGVPG